MADEDPKQQPLAIDLTLKVKSVALQRLIDEVRNDRDADTPLSGYNRVYHRHNR